MINFKLENIDKIVPWGEEPDLSLNWFGLTDGYLWLDFGGTIIYEYSEEVMRFWEYDELPYNNYQIVRFLEDFTDCFEKIGTSIPHNFYTLADNIVQFRNKTKDWLENSEDTDEVWEKYCISNSWADERLLDALHLIGNPNIYFFRHKDKIKIVWNIEYNLENGITLWKAKNGSFEMNYLEFVNEIKKFGENFFNDMDYQIELALAKDWGNIKIDKQRLTEEHKERKLDFEQKISFLEQEQNDNTNWNKIEKIYNEIK